MRLPLGGEIREINATGCGYTMFSPTKKEKKKQKTLWFRGICKKLFDYFSCLAK